MRFPRTIAQIKFHAAIRKAAKDKARKAQLEQRRAEAIKAIDKVVEDHRAAMKHFEAAASMCIQLGTAFGEIAKKTREMIEANKKKRAAR